MTTSPKSNTPPSAPPSGTANASGPSAVDGHLLRLLVGLVALLLPYGVWALGETDLSSISAAYHSLNALARDVFVGGLVFIAGFLLVYRHDDSWAQWWLAKLAALGAFGVAWVPCGCGEPSRGSGLHYAFAGVLFLVLIRYCWMFYRSAAKKIRLPTSDPQSDAKARMRCRVYAACFLGMVGAMLVVALGVANDRYEALVFWGEAVALTCFGISWLTASHVAGALSPEHERRWMREWLPSKA